MPRKSASGRSNARRAAGRTRSRRGRANQKATPPRDDSERRPANRDEASNLSVLPSPGRAGVISASNDSPGVASASSPSCSEARGASRANARELAEAVFAKVDPVKVGRELLEGGDAKGGSVRARVWEKLLEYRYGRPPAADSAGEAAGGAPLCVRIISHIPRPQRDDHVEAT